jgi:hypothetical protein
MSEPVARWTAGLAPVALALAALAIPAWAADEGAGPPSVEALVCHWIDSIPWTELRAFDAEAGARTIELLRDPTQHSCHANALQALGIAAPPGAYEAISDYAREAPSGEVDRSIFAARSALPIALGHLARSDDRALRDLLAAARAPSTPAWSYRTLRGERLALELRQGILQGLALSGRPEAASLLAESEENALAEPGLARERAAARSLHARIAREGADAVFGAPAPGAPR